MGTRTIKTYAALAHAAVRVDRRARRYNWLHDTYGTIGWMDERDEILYYEALDLYVSLDRAYARSLAA
jgi:hypothetical protein